MTANRIPVIVLNGKVLGTTGDKMIGHFLQRVKAVFFGKGLWAIAAVLLFGLWGCSSSAPVASPPPEFTTPSEPVVTNQLAEVGTPSLIYKLREELAQYQPQVQILSPQPGELLESSAVTVKLKVSDLPIFKDEELNMGPHLHLFVDDQPYIPVYDASEPVVLENLTPGSHILRVFASRPWHESFKNEGAYAETTFSIFTENNTRLPDFEQPLLTYSRPQGTYGTEPIMLDFYLTNAPLHFVANSDQEDNVEDWRIRVTINGESFILDNWQPVYLEGFRKGENWLKLEFVDENGELVENVYNNPVRVINYDPKLKDTLAKLVQNKISLRKAKQLVTTAEIPEDIEEELTIPDLDVEPMETVDETEESIEVEIPLENDSISEQELLEENPIDALEEELETETQETPELIEEDLEIGAPQDESESLEDTIEEELTESIDEKPIEILDTPSDLEITEQEGKEEIEESDSFEEETPLVVDEIEVDSEEVDLATPEVQEEIEAENPELEEALPTKEIDLEEVSTDVEISADNLDDNQDSQETEFSENEEIFIEP